MDVDSGFISVEQQVEIGGQTLHLSGKVDLLALTSGERQVVLELLDTFARLGKPRTRARRKAEAEDES
jgi:hypothetical protein